MKTIHQPRLTASELAFLWTTYQNDTMSICMFNHFLSNIDDHSIQEVLEYSLELSKRHIKTITEILKKEQYLIPQGFSESDVNQGVPRLFTDVLYLQYILNMSELGMTSYSIALSTASRDDVIEFYVKTMDETMELHKRAKRLTKEKGLYHRDIGLSSPKQIEFVQKQSYLAGFIKERRPLLGIEISNLWYDSLRNTLAQALSQGFSQVAKSKQLRSYFENGRELLGKHLRKIGDLFDENYLSKGAFNLIGEVTDSNAAPFSDKLLMFHYIVFFTAIMGQYGTSLS